MKDLRRCPETGKQVDLRELEIECQNTPDPWGSLKVFRNEVREWPTVDQWQKDRDTPDWTEIQSL